jgi:SacI homology domain
MGYGGLAEVAGTTRMSFVQTRGSVPVYWAEINNLRYKPDLQVMDRSDTVCIVYSCSNSRPTLTPRTFSLAHCACI